MGKIKDYYSLTKPGVLYGNVITGVAGFLLGAQGHIDWGLFVATILGMSLVIGSACVVNNFLDQDIDQLMERTKKRAIVNGSVPGRNAVIFGVILGLLGAVVLGLWTNWIVVAIGIIGFVDYVVLYGMMSKRMSRHGTLVGSISGAMPILAGYCAATGKFDAGAIIVFLALFFWQMPEFYSIAIYRRKEYKAAGVPVITVEKSVDHTKKLILLYTILFVFSTLALSVFNYTGLFYTFIMSLLGIYWIQMGTQGLKAKNSDAWARKMFHFSLIVLLVFSFLISIEAWMP